MKIKVTLKQRSREVFAEAVYEGEIITVQPGGKISKDFANHIKGGRKARSYRDNPEYVDEKGNILRKCIFKSPSTAAQFVTGNSTNGYEAWKVEEKKSLGKYLKEKGLRD